MARKRKRMPEGPFYRDLGRAIRLTRAAAGKTQLETAAHLAITFQQLQKYERGANRIPVDRLVRLSAYLGVPVSHFIASESGSDQELAFHIFAEGFHRKEFRTLVESWKAIKDRRMRTAMLDLVKRMAALTG